MAILTNAQIANLLAVPKPISRKQVVHLKTKGKANGRGDVESKVRVVTSGRGRRTFQITASKKRRPLQFSIILSFSWYGRQINLIRCNGHHREHTNLIEERSKIGVQAIPANTFHIHVATHRYQLEPESDAEAYAEPTDRYFSFVGAIEFLCNHYGFYLEDDDYGSILPLFRDQP